MSCLRRQLRFCQQEEPLGLGILATSNSSAPVANLLALQQFRVRGGAVPDFEVLRRIAATSAISEAEAFEAHNASDYEDDPNLRNSGQFEAVGPSDDEVRALISEDARLAVINFEVTSEAAYQRKYERQIAPAGDSGITIGVGYDLGYNEPDGVRRDLAGLIADADIETLVRACGLRGETARRRLSEFRNVRVPWDAALKLFERATTPRFGRLTLQTFPNSALLAGHAFGALFSLVYNRGTSMSGDRRAEMKAIRDLCAAKNWQGVPGEFRKMKRLWEGKPGLAGVAKRRDAEAILFQRGLELMHVAAASPTVSTGNLESVRSDAYLEGDGYAYEELPEGQFESENPEWDRVKWPADDNKAPDYRHIIDRSLSGHTFEFGPDEFELLMQSNAFEPTRQYGRIPFALRGAELVTSLTNPVVETKQEYRTTLTLRDVRPDHRSFRCVIGVYDCDKRRISGFASSTVPNPKAVATHVARPPQANMMLTGCYPFVVGWHQWSKEEKRIPGCLVEDGFQKAVLRSRDYVIEITDEVDNKAPCGDNNHPGKSEGPFPFSSWGCLVVKGSVEPVRGGIREQVTHTGEWALYRKALGLPDRGTGGHGNKFDFVLLTGLEGAIAHSLVKAARGGTPADASPLTRLRQGSRGPRVKKLQQHLGLSPSGYFDHATTKALATKQKTLGWCDGTYAPALDGAFGFDVFAPAQVAVLESRGDAAESHDKFEELFFELGLENETNRRGSFESAGNSGAMLESTYIEFGPAALKSIGRSIAKEIELQVQGYICGPETIDRIIDRQTIRDQVDHAAKLGVGVLKQCLVSIIATTTTWFVSRGAIEKLVDVILERIVQPAVGQSTIATINRIDGGVTWVCELWRTNIEGRYGVSVPVIADPLPSDNVVPLVPAADPAAPKQIDTLLGLIEESAFGAKVDAVGVRNYLTSLRKIIDDPGQQITDEQASRLIKALCDSAFMEQVQGATGHDPYLMVSDLENVLQAASPDVAKARTLTKDLHGLLADARIALLPDAIERVLKSLRSRRLFDEMSWLADRFLTRNPALAGAVAPIYAQGLIDGGRITAGISVLENAAQRSDLTNEQLAEVRGLLGRAHKQVYANHVRSASEAIALRQSFEPHLVSAIEHYSSIYDPKKPDEKYWHGINAVALLKCAERDRILIKDAPDATLLASNMISALEPSAQNTTEPFAIASIGEAYLARGDEANAAKYYGLFARHPQVNAFALASAARQLEEIWRIKAGTDGAGAILTGLKAALAVSEGGTLQLSQEERRTIQAAETVAFADEFERATQDGQYINFATLKMIVERGASVAAIQRPLGNVGETLGTGFLVSHTQFSGLDPSKSYVLTNAHVMTDDHVKGADPASAMRREQARIVFENEEIDGKRDVYLAKRVVWQSPSNALDATLIELDRKVEVARPLQFAPPDLALEAEQNGRKGTRLAVLGHPKGGRLSLSLQGSLNEMRAVLVDKGCRTGLNDPEFLHYSTPTEGGNSGSPVFEVDSWQVVGLHHAGYPDNGWPALGGRSGTNKANEGIWIESIRRAVIANNDASPPPKKKWFRS